MKISIIGTGNMAHFIGERLKFKGLSFVEVVGRDEEKLADFTKTFGGIARKGVGAMQEMADILIVAVKDDAIEEIVKRVSALQAKMIVHCSGTQSIDCLGNSFEAKAVVWPVYSLNKNRTNPYPEKVPIVVEWAGNESYKDLLKDFLAVLTQKVYFIEGEQRSLLHLGAVLSNNYMHHLMVLTEEYCEKYNLPFEALKPIIYQTAAQVEKDVPLRDLQTGPAVRNDEISLSKHRAIIEDDKDLLELYNVFVKTIQNKKS